MSRQTLTGAEVFDGRHLLQDHAVVIENGSVMAVLPISDAPEEGRLALAGGYLVPGLIDLQINGGGGIMVDGGCDMAALHQICAAHIGLGTTAILPTLITDTAEATRSVIAAGIAASRAGVAGFAGLHLEGPHLDPLRKGAHDAGLIRPMNSADLHHLCEAAQQLPALMITVAPEAVTPEQIAALDSAGAIVSLGHSDCSYETAAAAIAAGARCVTHLFNAMSQLGNRNPGLVGAALTHDVAAGLIADSIHVHPATMRAALAAKPHGVFLVSDGMAFAGSDLQEITLGGRKILRHSGRLTLADGTLAGADLTLPQAIRNMVETVGLPVETALAMATSRPATLIRQGGQRGYIAEGTRADLLHLSADFAPNALCLGGVWQ